MGNGMNKVISGLYLGNFRDAKDQTQLQTNGITHIVSIHESPKPFYEDRKYLCIVATDTSGQNISQHFSNVNDFIHEARTTGGNVLVHCLAGVSRSTTVVVAYLMTLSGLPWKDCLAAVQSARPCASPNFNFQRQLLEFQYEHASKEQKRLLEKFPSSKDSLQSDVEEIKSAAEAFKKQQEEKENLRQEVRQIINRPVQSEASDQPPTTTATTTDGSNSPTPKNDESPAANVQPASCSEILTNLNSLLSE